MKDEKTMEKQIEEMAADIRLNMQIQPNPKEHPSHQLARLLVNDGYRKIYDDLQRQCTCYALGCQMAEQLKSKVAEEIICDIEALLSIYTDNVELSETMRTLIEVIKRYLIAELKKKYTEEIK